MATKGAVIKAFKKIALNEYILVFFGLVAIGGLYLSSLYSYDLFHILAEIFSIIVGVSIFIVAWNTRETAENKYLLFIGIAFLFISALDLTHALSYKGMGLLRVNESDVATQLWIAARYVQSLSFIIAFTFIWGRKSLKAGWIVFGYAAITILVLLSIFYWQNFPACFVIGHGLTPFKIISEYIISLILIASIVIVYIRRGQIDKTVWWLLILSFTASIISEIAFIFYIDVFGFSNLVGHIFKIIAFYFLYQGIVVSVFKKPLNILFFELNKSRNSLIAEKALTDIAESKLKEERDQAKIYLRSIGKGIIVIDREWKITLWNNEATLITGYAETEAIGKNFHKIIKVLHEFERKENITFIEDSMVLGRTVELLEKTIIIGKGDKEVPISGSAAPIRDKHGIVTGAIIIMQDITEEREVARMRSDFTYASHQLRTPVTRATWLLESILHSNDIKKIKENTKKSYQALRSVSKLSGELVDISEIEQGLIIPTAENVNLADLCNEVIGLVEEIATANGIEVALSLKLSNSIIVTFPRLLVRSLVEILNNGIVYSPKNGKITMTVTQSQDVFLFEIQDFGIGIDFDHQPLVFTKFFRGNNFDTSEIAGGGLGLYIAKEYINLLHGKIWFESKPKEGSTFYVSIPLYVSEP